MKLVLVSVLATAAVAAATVLQGRGPITNMSTPSREAAYTEMQAFAEGRLKLQRVECGDIMTISPDEPCYVTDLKPGDVRRALTNRPELQPLTGWRDDYGVLSAGFGWKNGPWRMGVVYGRASASDFGDRPDIQKHAGMVAITIDTK